MEIIALIISIIISVLCVAGSFFILLAFGHYMALLFEGYDFRDDFKE